MLSLIVHHTNTGPCAQIEAEYEEKMEKMRAEIMKYNDKLAELMYAFVFPLLSSFFVFFFFSSKGTNALVLANMGRCSALFPHHAMLLRADGDIQAFSWHARSMSTCAQKVLLMHTQNGGQ